MNAVRNVVVRVGADTGNLSKGLKNAQSQMNIFHKKMASVGKALVGIFAVQKITQGIEASLNAYGEYSSAITGLQSLMEAQGKSFDTAKTFIDSYIKDGLVPATNAIQAYKMLLSRGYDDKQIQDVMTRLKDSAAFNRQSSLSMGEAIQSAAEGLKNENSVLVDNAGVTKNVSMMWKDYAKSIGTSADKLTLAQKRQAEYNGIMQETQFQVGNAAKYTDTYQGKVAAFNQTLYRLQIAWGQTFAKIGEIVLPALTSLAESIIQVGNVFNQFISALTGAANKQQQTTNTAKQAAKTEKTLGAAIGGAAKKAKGAVAGFDEINELQEQMADSGAGAIDGIESTSDSIGDITNATVGDGLIPQSTIDKINEFKQRFTDALPEIQKVATILGIALLPLIISTGVEAAKSGVILIAKFVYGIVQSGVTALVASVQLASKFIAEVIRTAIFAAQAAWELSLMIAQFILAGVKAAWSAIQLGISTAAMITAKVATAALTAAQWLLNAAVSAFPILLLVAALGLLAKTFNDTYAEETTFTGKWNQFCNDVKWTFIGMGTGISNAWKNFWDGIEDERGKRSGGFKEKWDAFWGGVGTGWSNFWLGVQMTFIDILNGIIDSINWLLEKWNSFKFKTPEISIAGQVIAKSATIGLPQINTIDKINYPKEVANIQKHANGGVFDGPTMWGNHLINESGTEGLIPLENSEVISQFAQAIGNAINQSSRSNQEIVISVDGVKLARAIIPSIKSEGNRIGNTTIIQTV